MGLSLNSTGDIWLFQNRHGNCIINDRGHCHFSKSTCDIGDPPVKGPPMPSLNPPPPGLGPTSITGHFFQTPGPGGITNCHVSRFRPRAAPLCCKSLLPNLAASLTTTGWNCAHILKPIFHQKTGLRWMRGANEIYTKNMKCTCLTRKCCVGTQRNLYSTGNF